MALDQKEIDRLKAQMNNEEYVEPAEDEAPKPRLKEEKLYSIRLLRAYVPSDTVPEFIHEEQGMGPLKKLIETQIFRKTPAGEILKLPRKEVDHLLKNKIGELVLGD